MTDRQPDFPIDPIFHTRWSPRAFAPEPMPETDLLRALEAARWAPSAYNVQPWRFVYALRGDAFWERFLDVLVPFNRSWAANASALVFVVSDTLLRYEGELSPSRSHAFDAGAAWAQLALQATQLGWHAHGIGGLDYDRAHALLGVPEGFRVEMAVAIGRRAAPETLPAELREREAPSPRRPVREMAFRGGFPR
ncbi:MAG TPA: nitroreductase family protein [Polyangiaceae bacterium LLY-WYZ-15_(1-7)]|nr:nitroreductase [Sandaracinus sp.]HJL04801.1 nitroreductase family protein [Polyangiaceae bacterium LLY-WYZ-15_(1-7)]HJL08472.1 nitroreductase family protein [Polyangiaceae bacterium LLY-WYZ-15_(1-7)]HJL22416.1 nitroreductase family protein [Polyangiaceae bacterium LLY-WYZ-15_(1-7)]HJL34296.1 nitroreductase family protein [Polyangiaceae bacterium LLY-WYZ-15_(1-7)]